MRILLINSNTKDDILASPPIGLSYVATAAEAAGHDAQVLDLCFRRNTFAAIKRAVAAFSPQLIGISIRNIDNVNLLRPFFYLDQVKKIVEYVRSVTHVPIVLGGSAASLNPEGVLAFIKGDYIIVSDGEEPLVRLAQTLENGTSPDNIAGLGRFVDGRFQLVPPQLKDFPIGAANLGRWIDMKPYTRIGSSYTVQSKRGCRERCIYCVYQLIQGHRLRMRSPKDVVDEIEEAHCKFKLTNFEFVDSVFNDPEDHAVEIMEEICRRNWAANFSATGIDPKRLNRKFLDLMWKAGFRSFMISPESACDTIIANYGKDLSVDDLVRATEAIDKTRMTAFWYFLVGGPGETNETLQETLGFILKHLKHAKHPPYHNINLFMGVRIYPGTGLWTIAVQEGLVHEGTDSLRPCWYLSKSLDLDRAVRQIFEAASLCPELYLGVDERYLYLSKVVAFFCKLFQVPRPYWRHIWGINRLLIKSGLRFAFQTKDVALMIRRQLEYQQQ